MSFIYSLFSTVSMVSAVAMPGSSLGIFTSESIHTPRPGQKVIRVLTVQIMGWVIYKGCLGTLNPSTSLPYECMLMGKFRICYQKESQLKAGCVWWLTVRVP